ncbi:MAG: preQ(1) synthase [Selenomonas sp.]|nr:preQ(1) synthase [Selenomonas sp.]
MRTARELEGVTSLGSGKTIYKQEYDSSLLERFVNKHPEAPYMVQLNCPEFTSLCPKTGQPDFAKILISYIPDKYLVESKSLKLYLFSFRNTGDFHEDIVNTIKNDLVRLLSPRYLEVVGLFNARGGISIYPTAFYCKDDAFQELAHQRMLEACKEK